MSKQTIKNVLKFAAGVGILAIVQEIIILVFFYKSEQLISMLLGTVYGSVYVILSFAHMGYCVEKCVQKEENQAKLYMQTRYTLRMLVLLAVMILAVYNPFINIYTAVIPLAFTRIVVMFLNVLKKRGGENK